jgi:hypothetical protein
MTGFKSKREAALDKLVEIQEKLGMYDDQKPAPPPPECKTEAEQTAYAFGWWKALEYVRTEQPAQRPWVGLTADEAAECWTTSATQTWHNFEAALKEKNFD